MSVAACSGCVLANGTSHWQDEAQHACQEEVPLVLLMAIRDARRCMGSWRKGSSILDEARAYNLLRSPKENEAGTLEEPSKDSRSHGNDYKVLQNTSSTQNHPWTSEWDLSLGRPALTTGPPGAAQLPNASSWRPSLCQSYLEWAHSRSLNVRQRKKDVLLVGGSWDVVVA